MWSWADLQSKEGLNFSKVVWPATTKKMYYNLFVIQLCLFTCNCWKQWTLLNCWGPFWWGKQLQRIWQLIHRQEFQGWLGEEGREGSPWRQGFLSSLQGWCNGNTQTLPDPTSPAGKLVKLTKSLECFGSTHTLNSRQACILTLQLCKHPFI